MSKLKIKMNKNIFFTKHVIEVSELCSKTQLLLQIVTTELEVKPCPFIANTKPPPILPKVFAMLKLKF